MKVLLYIVYILLLHGCVAYAGAVFQLHQLCLPCGGKEITEAQVKVKVLLYIVFMLLFLDGLPILEQCSSCITDVCSVVKRSLKPR